MPGERVVPSSFAARDWFAVPMFDAAEKENEHMNINAFQAPGNKPLIKKRNASTTGGAKKTKARAPFSSKKTSAATTSSFAIVRNHHVLNPFEGCNVSVSLHENDHRSVQAVTGSASKAKADEPDNHSSLLHHARGPVRSHHAAGVRTPRDKGR